MDDQARQKRQAGIYSAAYELLAAYGYGGTSMLRIAKAAKASNETLYRWYGDKDGLFLEMVRANAAETRQMLMDALATRGDPWVMLENVAPVFLRMILGEQAILLNRAAAADPSGALGEAISAGGRQEVGPLMSELMGRICAGTACNPQEATEWFISLLVGDLQIKRVINDLSQPTKEQIYARCNSTMIYLRRLILSA